MLPIELDGTEYSVEIQKKQTNELILTIENVDYSCTLIKSEQNKILFSLNQKQYMFHYSWDADGYLWLTSEGITERSLLKNRLRKSPNNWDAGTESNQKVNDGNIYSYIPGKITKIQVSKGEVVKKGALLAVIDSMKSENHVLADYSSVIQDIHIVTGQRIKAKDIMFTLKTVNDSTI